MINVIALKLSYVHTIMNKIMESIEDQWKLNHIKGKHEVHIKSTHDVII